MAAFGARAVEHSAIRCVLVENLALQDTPVLQGQMEDIPLRRVRHGVEPHDCPLSAQILQAVPDAAQVSMTAVEAANPAERLYLRHVLTPEKVGCKEYTCGAAMHFRGWDVTGYRFAVRGGQSRASTLLGRPVKNPRARCGLV